MPTITFSTALRSLKSRMFWNVLATPSPAMRCAGRPVSWSVSSQAVPDWKGTYPVMTLTNVVLPAPLGPMRPWIAPFSTSSDTPSTARTPPKWRWTLSSRRSTGLRSGPPAGADDGEAATTDDALRPEDDHGNQNRPAHDV